MTTMKAAQISKAGGDFELVERDIPEPGPRQVRVKVEACGICHSDVLVKDGLWPGLKYPRVPGHEIAGRVDALGDRVTNWKEGERVGIVRPDHEHRVDLGPGRGEIPTVDGDHCDPRTDRRGRGPRSGGGYGTSPLPIPTRGGIGGRVRPF